MLQASTIAIIKSTVPVLEVHGTAITTRFYQLLFTNHPELLNLFNHANQKQGRQQAALANAVYAAALHIDRLEAILPAVKQIAHKHRSLGITAEQYPIVGTYLLKAIKEVLGDAATDEILGAWAEAYGIIADVFISVEAQMYEAAEQQPGGWEGFKPFKVVRRQAESVAMTSFYLEPADGSRPAAFLPGQYVSVKLSIPGQPNTHIRQYSLSGAPDARGYRISVKREDGGEERPDGVVSNYMNHDVTEGAELLLSAPAGDFTIDAAAGEQPVVLLSGGAGITPMVSMLHHLHKADREATFIHATANSATHAFQAEVASLAQAGSKLKAFYSYSNPTEQDRADRRFDKEGRIDAAWLKEVIPAQPAVYFLCGSPSFLQEMYRSLQSLGVAKEQIHVEFFGPAASLE
ncbi:nitric oxide dioxygenase [Paenibacillus phyllosphaerae]|uniref:Flavohemoprotein n=1 Tax=Paenibacillus phyllosphaerae TaxID=274593 RepID=A0A7W5AXS1_9BACL|nr:NO-inducible flavohemoprotein [Paenibacillus phyllosphaerae]MBB3110677.1 nitric oxide dioxygenase [Paenibacillus phyllosphaerae]